MMISDSGLLFGPPVDECVQPIWL